MADAQGTAITTLPTTAFAPGTELGADGLPVQPAAAPAAEAPAIPDKFKNADGTVNTDALLASYTELEKKQSAPKADDTSTEEAPKADPSAEQQAAQDTLKSKGLELEPFNAEFAKDGKLSDDSYSKLEKAGFSKSMVDTYIQGVQAMNNAAAASVADIKSVAGGDEGYQNMVAWAQQSLDAAQVAEFNEAVSSGKPGIAKAAVTSLKAAYDAAEGREPSLISGGGRPSGETFRSWTEAEVAMRDPRYGKEVTYTKEIEAKLLRSDIRSR